MCTRYAHILLKKGKPAMELLIIVAAVLIILFLLFRKWYTFSDDLGIPYIEDEKDYTNKS